MPVVVGGTNYYIESLLWHVLIDGVPKEGDGKLIYERDKELYGGSGSGHSGVTAEKKRDSVILCDSYSSKRSRVSSGDGGDNSVNVGDENRNISKQEQPECNGKVTKSCDTSEEEERKVNGEGKDRKSKECNDGGDDESGVVRESDVDGGGVKIGDRSSAGASDSDGDSGVKSGISGGGLTVWQETDTPTDELYDRLRQVDPEMADTYHPNERRKIIR